MITLGELDLSLDTLTPLETRLLHLLLANAGQPVTTDRILVHVWDHRGGGDRQLLKQPRWLETVPDIGCRMRG